MRMQFHNNAVNILGARYAADKKIMYFNFIIKYKSRRKTAKGPLF